MHHAYDDILGAYQRALQTDPIWSSPKPLWVHVAERVIQEATRRLEAEVGAMDPAEWYMAQFETEDAEARA